MFQLKETSSPDRPQESLQIKQNDKFFSRLLSKESSMANSSYRVYYGGASGAVPFTWESQPGTPKYTFCDTTLPPLTPPPSYHFNSKKKTAKRPSKPNLLHTIFRSGSLKGTNVPPSPSSSSSLSSSSRSSSLSSSSTPMSSSKIYLRRSRLSSPGSSFDSKGDDEDPAFGSPTSTLCFGVVRDKTSGFRGCYSMVIVKNALLSLVGHGSSKGTA